MLESAGETEFSEGIEAPSSPVEEVFIQTQEPAEDAGPESAAKAEEGREDPFDAPVPESESGGYTNWWI